MSAVLDAKFSRRRRRSLQILSIASARRLKDTEDEVHCAHNFKCSMFQVLFINDTRVKIFLTMNVSR